MTQFDNAVADLARVQSLVAEVFVARQHSGFADRIWRVISCMVAAWRSAHTARQEALMGYEGIEPTGTNGGRA